MGLRSHKAVMAGIEMLEGRAVKNLLRPYKKRVMRPLVAALRESESFEALREKLGATVLTEMDAEVVANSLAQAAVVAALIGHAGATPRRKLLSGKRKA